MPLTLKQGDLAFVGKKAYLCQQVKKSTSKGNIALAIGIAFNRWGHNCLQHRNNSIWEQNIISSKNKTFTNNI